MVEAGSIFLRDDEHLRSELQRHIPAGRRYFVLADKNTAEHCLPVLERLLPDQGQDMMLMTVEAGEDAKQWSEVGKLYEQLMHYGADRKSLLINLGGGVVCDLGGFVAATFKRGIPFLHIPTTVMAQVDAAHGGKTGINVGNYKNMAGSFTRAAATLVYDRFLITLSKREVYAGFAEMLKHALTSDTRLWQSIADAPVIDLPFIRSNIEAAAQVKLDLVEQDFTEQGPRKALNFGHTIGHALESLAFEREGQDLLHGEAVALGMIAESHIAQSMGLLKKAELRAIGEIISKYYPAPELDELTYHRLIEIMRQDKKNKDDHIQMALIDGIGGFRIDMRPKMSEIIDSLIYLQRHPFQA